MFLAIEVLALILGAVRPRFQTVAVLFVVTPLAQVPRPVGMLIQPVAVSLIVLPVPLIHIPIRVPKLTFTVSLVVVPLTLILAAIGPDLGAPSGFHTLPGSIPMVNCLGIW